MSLPQIPVLLMFSKTSPSFKSPPFCTLSKVGSASATQSSCAGFVYTPMLALVGLTSVTVVVLISAVLLLARTGYLSKFEEEMLNGA